MRLSVQVLKLSFLPLVLFFLALTFFIYYKLEIEPGLSAQLKKDLNKYLISVFIISITFIIQRIGKGILSWYKTEIASRTQTTLDEEIIPFLRRAINIVVWTIAFLMILPLFGVNINALIATLGVGSLAIALAAQDTISNIIAGFMIMIDRPFKIGDRIKLPSGEVVEVLDIGIRRSKFLSQDKAIVIVPNLELSRSKIVNYSLGKDFNKPVS